MKEKISVIVPIYNVEKYINECIESIINQSYKNIEILLIDDGSPDNCPKICDKYAIKDKRIKVIHKKNGGLSDARNIGIQNATGKYIAFIDSDDYVDEKYIEKLYFSLINNNVTLSQCGIIKISDKGEKLENIGYVESKIIYADKILEDVYKENRIENTVVWNKLYLKSSIMNNLFPIGKINEDEFFTYKEYYKSNKVAVIGECLYYYRQNDNSIMGKKYNINRQNILEGIEERISFYSKNNEQRLKQLTIIEYLNQIIEHYYLTNLYLKDKEIIKKLEIKYKKYYFSIKEEKIKLSIKRKLKFFLFSKLPKLLIVTKKIKDKVW